MKLFSKEIEKDLDEIIYKIESGEDLLFINPNKEKFLVAREELNNKYATSLNCNDCSISTFDIDAEVLDIFKNAACYTDFKYKIEIYE